MDELDVRLTQAWRAVVARCERDPEEAARRYYRAQRVSLIGTPRAWCLALRASDTRLADRGFVADGTAEAMRRPHDIQLSAADLQALCGPVSLPPPGVPVSRACRLLGRDEKLIKRWVRRGVLRCRYEPAQRHGHFGKPVPVVWAEGWLDAGAKEGRPPDPAWGTLWQTLGEGLPPEFGATLRRVPRHGKAVQGTFLGWDWVCPGRWCTHAETWRPCGRVSRWLYAPMPVWTIGQAWGESPALRVPGQAAPWRPGLDDRWAGRRSLACHRCWRVRMPRVDAHDGWNQFITALTAGLLFGHEVERPRGG